VLVLLTPWAAKRLSPTMFSSGPPLFFCFLFYGLILLINLVSNVHRDLQAMASFQCLPRYYTDPGPSPLFRSSGLLTFCTGGKPIAVPGALSGSGCAAGVRGWDRPYYNVSLVAMALREINTTLGTAGGAVP